MAKKNIDFETAVKILSEILTEFGQNLPDPAFRRVLAKRTNTLSQEWITKYINDMQAGGLIEKQEPNSWFIKV